MAEKGIVVDDSASGESVACRDAYEQDEDTNERIVQLVDQAQRQHDFAFDLGESTAVGKIREVIGSDDTDFTSFTSSDIYGTSGDNLITCGDKTTLVALGYYKHDTASHVITLTPLVVDTNNRVIGFLTPKSFSSFMPDGGALITEAFHIKDGGDNWNIGEVLSWNVLGAERIGIHVAIDSASGYFGDKIHLFGGMISGPSFDTPAGTRLTAGSYTTEITSGGEG